MDARWSCDPCSSDATEAVARELGLARPAAAILVRRGHDTPEKARAFLAADERHPATLLGDAAEACRTILGHVAAESRIVVHGDYDVDGVCATTVMVSALRRLGANADWYLPSRFADGYGLNAATVERLAAQGTGLIVTVDCGITAVKEVALARALGVDVVVTDHHKPAEPLPDCPIVHPGRGGYPFPHLCGAAVAHKLAEALCAAAGVAPLDDDLDLVGLATLCDMVPLVGENRRLAKDGIEALRRTRRVGLRALMEVADLVPADADERAAGFRLGPRLNAAGRMQRADAALELLMTTDADRAAEVARELDALNSERRDEETRTLFAAEAQVAEQAHLPAYVVAGEGWHPGVVGIVAARLVERHCRPVLVAALPEGAGAALPPEGAGAAAPPPAETDPPDLSPVYRRLVARGSGRSIPGFDLHAGLAACAHLLERFGGHRAAAGFEVAPDRIPELREAFAAHAASVLAPEDLSPLQRVDAVVSARELGLPLAGELAALGPFGQGNPQPVLLLPAARLEGIAPMGEDRQHARLTIASGGARARAVAFRTGAAELARTGGAPHDVAVGLEANEWNGAVEPRLIIHAVCPPRTGPAPVAGEEPFWDAVERELREPPTGPWPRAAGGAAQAALIERRGNGIAAACGELLVAGESVLALCADPSRRQEGLRTLVAGLARGDTPPDFAIACWEDLAREPAIAAPFDHLVAIDPPPVAAGVELARMAPVHAVHLAWGPAEVNFALAVAEAELDLRPALAEAYRALRDGAPLEDALRGTGRHARPGRVAGRLLRVLLETKLATFDRDTRECRLVPDAPRTDLAQAPATRAYAGRLDDARSYLRAELGRRAARAA